MVRGRISTVRGADYIVAQLLGAVVGALLLRYAVGAELFDAGGGGTPALGLGVAVGRGIVIEAILTFFLVFAVFGTAVDDRGPWNKTAGFTIGLVIAFDILAFGPYTGAAMNPARWFGPALVASQWSDAIVWIVGPIAGGIIAGVLYTMVLLRGQGTGHALARPGYPEAAMVADVYLDAASATPLVPEARAAIVDALDRFGDPLAIHGPARVARTSLEAARASVADAIGAQPDEIVFTSGGTESIALAIWGGAHAIRELGSRIVVGAIEHPAVTGAAQTLTSDGIEVVRVPVDRDGRVDLDRYALEVRAPGTLLASGPAREPRGRDDPAGRGGRPPRARGGRPVPHRRVPDRGSPPGGRRDARRGPPLALRPQVRRTARRGRAVRAAGVTITPYPPGDDRERKRRSGMENTPGIAGMAAAIVASRATMADPRPPTGRSAHLRDRIAAGGAARDGPRASDAPHTPPRGLQRRGPRRGDLAMTLDDRGFRVAPARCSGRPEDPSPVLEELGHPRTTGFRVGLGPGVEREHVDALVDVLADTVRSLQRVESASSEALARFSPPGR